MNTGPKPGDFPIGSLDSRAAMRGMIENEENAGPQMVMRLGLAGHGPEDCRGTWCLHERCVMTYDSGSRVNGGIVEEVIPMNTGGRKHGRT